MISKGRSSFPSRPISRRDMGFFSFYIEMIALSTIFSENTFPVFPLFFESVRRFGAAMSGLLYAEMYLNGNKCRFLWKNTCNFYPFVIH
jgi:hypothetical protein